jgi:hypothetical protein
MDFQSLYSKIQNFNNTNPISTKNIVDFNKEYRGNQHDLDTFNNTVQYIEYKKNLRKEKLTIRKVSATTYDNYDSIQEAIENSQYKKKWSRLDTYCKKVKISEYIEKQTDSGEIEQLIMKDCIAHLYRLLEQKKLNKKGNIEYDSDKGVITSISQTLFNGIMNT